MWIRSLMLALAACAWLVVGCGGDSPSTVDGGTDSDTDSDSDSDTDSDTDSDSDSDTDSEVDELCDEIAAYYEECGLDEAVVAEVEDCCPVAAELFDWEFMELTAECALEASCEDLLDDEEAVMDECWQDAIDDAEPGDAHDTFVEALCDHVANDCDWGDFETCVDEFWTGPDAEDNAFFLIVKDAVLEEVADCFDDLDPDACEEADFDDCFDETFEELDTCGT
jgi:hypothetical protein